MAQFDVLSLIQPSGDLHLGNYFGAIANWVRLQDEKRCVFGVVDYHAMTVPYDPKKLRQRTWDMGLDLMACGLDPEKCLLIIQSLVPEHTELAWIFSAITPYSWVAKMTQFKDKSRQVEEQGESISAGLFMYPVLQAADILMYKAAHVPVGEDQNQHLELARDIARTFNRRFGETFPEPTPLHTKTPKILSPADPAKKMSKSLGTKHVIGVFEDPAVIRRKVKSAVTDTGDAPTDGSLSAGVEGLLTLLEATGAEDEARAFRETFATGERRYAPLKEVVAEALVQATEPLRERAEGASRRSKAGEADPQGLFGPRAGTRPGHPRRGPGAHRAPRSPEGSALSEEPGPPSRHRGWGAVAYAAPLRDYPGPTGTRAPAHDVRMNPCPIPSGNRRRPTVPIRHDRG